MGKEVARAEVEVDHLETGFSQPFGGLFARRYMRVLVRMQLDDPARAYYRGTRTGNFFVKDSPGTYDMSGTIAFERMR